MPEKPPDSLRIMPASGIPSHNDILYDRDENGEFFQFYGQTFGEGFFFEVLERRGGYAGYGAPNAPFRIAAQKLTMRPAGIPRA